MRAIKASALVAALAGVSLTLLGQEPATVGIKSESPEKTAKALAVTDSLTIKSEMAEFFIHPIKCDAEGNLYLMTGVDATSGIREINSKGQRVANFLASAATGLSVWHGTYFAVAPNGSVYQLADLRDSRDRAVISYNKDGSYKSAVKLEAPHGAEDWNEMQIAVFPSGDFLIAGSIHNPDTAVRTPFTGIFDSSGAIKREITLPDDADLQKMAESGDPRVIAPGHASVNRAVELGYAEAGSDGNVYLMRRISPAIVYAISPGGEVVRRFTVDPVAADYTPISMHIAGGRIAILFREPQIGKELVKVTDLEGTEIATYIEPTKDTQEVLGSALACYAQNPERFTFLFTSDDGYLGFRIAEPR